MNKKSRRVHDRVQDIRAQEYFRVDVSVVWDTVKSDLPKLESLLETINGDDGEDDRCTLPIEK